jgi:hypothetical protein
LKFRAQSRWAYLMPALHLFACLIGLLTFLLPPQLSGLAIIWEFIMLADLPASTVAFAAGMVNGPIAVVWILIVGTSWWYLLSLGIAAVYGHFKHRNERLILDK